MSQNYSLIDVFKKVLFSIAQNQGVNLNIHLGRKISTDGGINFILSGFTLDVTVRIK